jgi:hypothetical protein
MAASQSHTQPRISGTSLYPLSVGWLDIFVSRIRVICHVSVQKTLVNTHAMQPMPSRM